MALGSLDHSRSFSIFYDDGRNACSSLIYSFFFSKISKSCSRSVTTSPRNICLTMSVKLYHGTRFATSILHLKPKHVSALTPLFVWIPGNPGILQYYEEMLQRLHEKHDTWEILAISHAGMSLEDPNVQKTKATIFSLEEQIQHKVEVINQFSSENRPLIVMGHSVGAYMAQHAVLDSKLVGKVIKIGLITPTVIDIHLSQKGTQMTTGFYWLSGLPGIAAWTSNFLFNKLSFVPYTDYLVSFMMDSDKDSIPVTTSKRFLQNSETVRQALGLAKLEMEQIRDDWPFQQKLIDFCNERNVRTWFLFSTNDHWVSESTRNALIKFYRERYIERNLEIQVVSDIAHSFVVKESKYIVDEYF